MECNVKEIWKDVKDFEKLYQVSNFGNIRSLNKLDTLGRKVTGKLMKPIRRKDGYFDITLRKNNIQKHYLLHRLIAITFIENKNNYKEINHKDENKTNNNINNLEWCNRSYNINYGKANDKRRNKLINNKRSKKVLQFNLNNELINTFNSLNEVKRQLNYSISGISQCCNGERKTSHNYIWRYE